MDKNPISFEIWDDSGGSWSLHIVTSFWGGYIRWATLRGTFNHRNIPFGRDGYCRRRCSFTVDPRRWFFVWQIFQLFSWCALLVFPHFVFTCWFSSYPSLRAFNCWLMVQIIYMSALSETHLSSRWKTLLLLPQNRSKQISFPIERVLNSKLASRHSALLVLQLACRRWVSFFRYAPLNGVIGEWIASHQVKKPVATHEYLWKPL